MALRYDAHICAESVCTIYDICDLTCDVQWFEPLIMCHAMEDLLCDLTRIDVMYVASYERVCVELRLM